MSHLGPPPDGEPQPPTQPPRDPKPGTGDDAWPAFARDMVDTQIRERSVNDPRVLDVMAQVPRHLFAPGYSLQEAYGDFPLPIGHQQTISQPYIVAAMTEILRPLPTHTVLEIGTGSGYQAAILSRLVRHVHTVEILEPLAQTATQRLRDLHFNNITVHVANGWNGWPHDAPYDAILVAAAPERLPTALIQQLRPGARMIAPIGPAKDQILVLYEKNHDGKTTSHSLFDVRFVPLIVPGEDPS